MIPGSLVVHFRVFFGPSIRALPEYAAAPRRVESEAHSSISAHGCRLRTGKVPPLTEAYRGGAKTEAVPTMHLSEIPPRCHRVTLRRVVKQPLSPIRDQTGPRVHAPDNSIRTPCCHSCIIRQLWSCTCDLGRATRTSGQAILYQVVSLGKPDGA
ncbi:hypothetical protein BAUCODRAFT_540929 [Baudoinia panamericana UAMH 10762]|uniref:Uncharacterized protein n=1 Tax=Baudoinia panamericana (strain UAMH 10762) TaxID=717646 RepID=M2LM67_BAUPA|nr:uncharacterized protein BAUCODRAFT_540929 [Baudoinia panamericana UAMH 10762]EMC95412.1 hypothetical protein BAUCODRAFT_540929 [Baudoinia panamericana UAMH 10762]